MHYIKKVVKSEHGAVVREQHGPFRKDLKVTPQVSFLIFDYLREVHFVVLINSVSDGLFLHNSVDAFVECLINRVDYHFCEGLTVDIF